jgi:hypothetical protein
VNRILEVKHDPVPSGEMIPFRMAWKIAAAVLLLISLNVFTLVYLSSSSATGQSASGSIASEYFFFIDRYNL